MKFEFMYYDTFSSKSALKHVIAVLFISNVTAFKKICLNYKRLQKPVEVDREFFPRIHKAFSSLEVQHFSVGV